MIIHTRDIHIAMRASPSGEEGTFPRPSFGQRDTSRGINGESELPRTVPILAPEIVCGWKLRCWGVYDAPQTL